MDWRVTVLCMLSVALAPALVSAQVVEGTVVESADRRPVAAAEVMLLDTTGAIRSRTRSEDNGSFSLSAPFAGSYLILVERMGFQFHLGDVITVGEGERYSIKVELERNPVEVRGIVVEAERRRADHILDREGFYFRQKALPGWFMGPEELGKTRSVDAADLLRRAPFVVRRERFGQPTLVQMMARGGGRCYPGLQVDGMVLPPNIDINHFVSVDEILGVEVYRGASQTPPQWGPYSGCGMILIWTRRGEGI